MLKEVIYAGNFFLFVVINSFAAFAFSVALRATGTLTNGPFSISIVFSLFTQACCSSGSVC